MPSESHLRKAAGWIGFVVGALGLVTLAGAVISWNPFKLGNAVNLNPSVALVLMLSGASLWLQTAKFRRAGIACGAAVLVITVTLLFQRLLGLDLGLNQLGRLSLHVALGWTTAALALLALPQERGRLRWPLSAWLSNLVIAIGIASLLAQVLASEAEFARPLRPASHCSITLVLLGIGMLLARPDDKNIRLLVEPTIAGMHARRLFVGVAIVPLVLSVILAWALKQDLLAVSDGLLLLIIGLIICGFAIAQFSIAAAAGLNDDREEAEQARLLLTRRLQEQADELQKTVALRTQELLETNARLQTVADSNALLAMVAQHTINGVIITDADGRIEWVNEAFTRTTGFTLDESRGQKPGQILQGPGTDLETVAKMRDAQSNGRAFHLEVLNYTKDRTPFWQLIDMQPVRDRDGRLLNYIANQTDITARKQLEERLRKTEGLANEVSRLAQIGGWEIDLIASTVTWTDGTRRIHEVDEAFQPTIENIWEFFPPESLAAVQAAIRDVTPAAPSFDLEVQLLSARARHIWVRILGHGEFSNGRELSIHGAIQDVTSRHQNEDSRRELEARLFQAQKMETLGTLAGGIAHDFNNLLTGIIGYHELAADSIPEDNPARACLHEARNASLRARELVEQILTFGRQSGGGENGPIDLSLVAEEARRFLRATLPANISIEVNCAPYCGNVLADATQIHQVILNLGSNAGHAMRQNGGVLRISLEPSEVSPDLALTLGGPPAKSYVRVSVSDTGHGMDEATRRRIFDPFFTTKNTREGTGLGLAVVHGIVRSHRGAIDVESTPGRGSVFHIYLPTAEENPVVEMVSEAAPHGTGEYICVVDDEEVVGGCTKLVLESKGYRSLIFPSAEACLAQAQADMSLCAVLVTDQTMPGMQGTELAAAMRRLNPNLPIVIMSGYFSKISSQALDELGQVELLAKPFTSDELAHAVHRALRSSGRAVESARH